MIRKVFINCNKDGQPTEVECYCENNQLFDKTVKLIKINQSKKSKKCRGCKYICDVPTQFMKDLNRISSFYNE